MLPTTREIAFQIAIMHELYPKDTISQLAAKLMFSPIFVINALDEGEKMELFSRVKDKDILVQANPVNYQIMLGVEFGADQTRVQNEILRVIASANKDEDDVEEGILNLWLRGIAPSQVEMAIHVLKQLDFITSYELVDPKDVKSKYTFYTLRVNEGKNWGVKQFKKPTSKKKK